MKNGDKIWWRRKGIGHISMSYIQEVEDNLIAVRERSYYTDYPMWLKLDEIEILKVKGDI